MENETFEPQTRAYKNYVIRAWPPRRMPQDGCIFAQTIKIASTLDPDVILRRATGTIQAEILKLGFSGADVQQTILTVEAVDTEKVNPQ